MVAGQGSLAGIGGVAGAVYYNRSTGTNIAFASYSTEEPMPETASIQIGQVHALLAAKRFSVTELGDDVLKIEDVDSKITIRAVLEGDILFLSLVCLVAPKSAITAEIMHKMLAAENGISTSYFQLYETGDGNVAVTLNNFCKLQEMGPDDEDDIISCVSFLLADVVHAKDLLGADLKAHA